MKGVASMELHRNIGVTQKTAWFVLQRIREALKGALVPLVEGPVEAGAAYFGGCEANRYAHKHLNAGHRSVGNTAVVAGLVGRRVLYKGLTA